MGPVGSAGGAGRGRGRAQPVLRVVGAAVVATAVLAGDGVASPALGRVTERGPVELVGPVSVASDINDRGVVVGWYAPDHESEPHAFRRSPRGRVTDLGPGLARAVNDAGVVVGERQDAQGTRHATRWGLDGEPHDLGAGDDSWANDVNDRGMIVGYTRSPLGYRAFAAVPGSAPVLLPHPPGVPEHQDIATAVNERGDIAGYAVRGDTGRLAPVVWRGRRHTPTLLPAPNVYQDVTGINEHGTVVGTAVDGTGYRAVVWTGRDHRELDVTAPGDNALGRAINDRGQVAGNLLDTGGAFRWDPRTGRTTILQGLSASVEAYGMDDRGCVVGSSYLPDTSTRATLFAPCRRGVSSAVTGQVVHDEDDLLVTGGELVAATG